MAAASNTQVLEFDLGTERYCIDIEFVSQIVDRQHITPLPNAPTHVEGVTDLRGETTTIVDPKVLFDIEATGDEDHIVVFDSDQLGEGSAMGWQIDMVHRVVDVAPDEIESSPIDGQTGIEGVIDRGEGEGFVIWVSPDAEPPE
ncbi:chemotaxis protein CheW [Natronomonas salsuginis]|jgi:purine-binding chemotaxis protein CheW|uniref:Chemotaxis protein CheW n=1 Tax=Natronomonas salsuginis TaxID=2217661 RepID=A0A4U5J912_9EURY|nr:chemotaxis protein CheW [Natronomonas salsuginis]TKR25600.1 chemotaxis protein CheW [Natronomonas salsuginis]